MTGRGPARAGPRAVPPRTQPRRRRALGTWAVAGALTVGLAAGLGGCANSAALGLVRQACHHVEISLSLYRSSIKEPDPTIAAKERAQAERQLEIASPLAAIAAGQAPQWQAFMATLAENTRLPESDLVHALSAQCGAVSAGGSSPGAPGPPGITGTTGTTLPPPPPGS